MKARVKATGRIIEVVGEGIQNSNMVMAAHGEWFTKDELDIVPLSWKPFEPTYWQKLEHQYAGMAMQEILRGCGDYYELTKLASCAHEHRAESIAEVSRIYAHALVEKMKEERK